MVDIVRLVSAWCLKPIVPHLGHVIKNNPLLRWVWYDVSEDYKSTHLNSANRPKLLIECVFFMLAFKVILIRTQHTSYVLLALTLFERINSVSDGSGETSRGIYLFNNFFCHNYHGRHRDSTFFCSCSERIWIKYSGNTYVHMGGLSSYFFFFLFPFFFAILWMLFQFVQLQLQNWSTIDVLHL